MIISVTGKNGFLASQKLESLRTEFEQEFGTTNLSTLSADDIEFNELSEKLYAQGLFSACSMVVLKNISKNAFLQEKILENLEKVPDESTLIIYEPEIDKRSKFYKKIKTDTVFHDFAPLDEFALKTWAAEEAKKIELDIGANELKQLIQRVNLDQWAVYNELQKLKNLDQKITRQHIEEQVEESFTDTIFSLLDLAFSKKPKQAVDMYQKMRSNRVEPHYILSMIAWQLHIIVTVAHGAGRSADEIARTAKISPYVVRKTQGLLQKTSITELHEIVNLAVKVDYESKTNSSIDVDANVALLLAKIAE